MCSARVTFEFLLQNNPCQGHPSSWGWSWELWKNQAPSQVTAAGSGSAFGCSQVMRRHKRCWVLIHKHIWVWVISKGDILTGRACIRSRRRGLTAWESNNHRVLLGVICFFYILDGIIQAVKKSWVCKTHALHLIAFCMLCTSAWQQRKCFKKTDGAILCTQGSWGLEIAFLVHRIWGGVYTYTTTQKQGQTQKQTSKCQSDRTYRQLAIIFWRSRTRLLIQHKEKKK